MGHDLPDRPIRVVIQQPALAGYRVPVYRELNRRPGVRVHVVHAKSSHLPNLEADGFDETVSPMWRRPYKDHTFYWHPAQWRYASPAMADVLILSWDVHYLSLLPALLRARLTGVPTVLWGHGYSKKEASWRRSLRQQIGALGTALLFYNHTTANQYLEDGFSRQRVYVALNSLDQTPIQHAQQPWLEQPSRLTSFQQQHGLDPSATVLFVSRLDPANHVDWLLQAAAPLSAEVPSLKVVIVGTGEDLENLKQLARSLRIEDRVLFLGAIYEEDQLAPWFLSSTTFCYPANIGLSLLHAFGYGLPVITSDRVESQNPEIEALRHGKNGLLYTDGHVASLTHALRQVLTDKQQHQQMSQQARQTVTQEFTLEKMVDGMEAAIRYCHRRD